MRKAEKRKQAIKGYKGQKEERLEDEATKKIMEDIQAQKKQLEKLETTRKVVGDRIKVLEEIKKEYMIEILKQKGKENKESSQNGKNHENN